MCLIIHNPNAIDVPLDIIDNALCINPDGFGIFFHDTSEVMRTMDWDKVYDLVESGRPYTAHFRYATSGKVSARNCHPFKIDDRFHLMMNGTIDRLKSDKSVDTKRLCRILKGLPKETIVSILGTYACRFALLDVRDGGVTIVNEDLWIEQDGVLYSKANCFSDNLCKPKGYSTGYSTKFNSWNDDAWGDVASYDDEDWGNLGVTPKPSTLHTVAVYGTLKWGHGNHDRFLKDSYSLGGGVTSDPYPLLIDGLPYLIYRKGHGHKVEVEVYRVDDETLSRLDGLEGHPNWYERKKIRITLDKGGEVSAWCYLVPDSPRYVKDTSVYHRSFL